MPSTTLELKKIIKAGAGAGKTTTLVNQLYSFFSQFKKINNKAPKIVVTTFTKKATQELKERLLKKAIEEDSEDFFTYINNKSLIHISTIHGVLHLVIKQNLKKMGLKSDLNIISENEEQLIYQKILRQLLTKDDQFNDLLGIYSVQELMKFCTEYTHLLSLNNTALVYSKEKFENHIKIKIKEIIKKLDHSVLILSDEKLSKGWLTWLDSYKAADRKQDNWLKSWVETQGNKPRRTKESEVDLYFKQSEFTEAIDDLKNLIKFGYLEDNLLDKYDEVMQGLSNLGGQFATQVKNLKKEESKITLRDIELLVVENLKLNPGLFDNFSNEWDFWMIDEYQDTSPLQEEVLKNLIKNRSNFLVGDPQQSIYLFRGARSEIFINKYHEYEEENNTLVLNKNYRSSAGVLDFINNFFSYDFTQFEKMEITKEKSIQQYDVEYLEIAEEVDISQAVLSQIKILVDAQVELEEIVILSRTNKELILLEKELKKTDIPYFYHSSGNFFQKREVLDALLFIKFLYNPHDDINFIGLLRTPWVGFSDSEIQSLKSAYNSRSSFFANLMKNSQDKRTLELIKYLHDFATLGVFETTKKFLFSSGLLLTSYHKDPSGQKESNIWKLLNWLDEIVKDYSKDLLQEINSILTSSVDDIETESESAAVIEPKRIQLMTVHASKGLQFKYVFLLSADKRPRSTNVQAFSYSEQTQEWSYILKEMESESNIYSPLAYGIKDELAKRESQEFWRLLYVALTRAKEKILIFSSAKPESNSWALKIKSFLQIQDKPQFSFAIKQLNQEDVIINYQSIAKHFMPDVFDFSSIEKMFAHESPNKQRKISFTGGKSSFSSKNSLQGLMKKERGIKEHFKFEKGNSHLAQLTLFDSSINWQHLLNNGYKEFGFSFKKEELTFTGSIDLWGVVDDICYVVDYKTGDKLDVETHMAQLRFYAQALQVLGFIKVEKIKLVICYMAMEKIVEKDYVLVNSDSFLKNMIEADKKS